MSRPLSDSGGQETQQVRPQEAATVPRSASIGTAPNGERRGTKRRMGKGEKEAEHERLSGLCHPALIVNHVLPNELARRHSGPGVKYDVRRRHTMLTMGINKKYN